MALSATSEFQQDTIMLQSPSMKPQKKSKPPPLVLCNTEAQYWPLLSPLAEFAAIATSPESPLVKEMSCDNDTVSNAFKVIIKLYIFAVCLQRTYHPSQT